MKNTFLTRLRFAVRYVISPTAPLSPREWQAQEQIKRLQNYLRLTARVPAPDEAERTDQ